MRKALNVIVSRKLPRSPTAGRSGWARWPPPGRVGWSPAGELAPGVYTVRWRVTGADGDLVESTFRFGVDRLGRVRTGRWRGHVVAVGGLAVADVRRPVRCAAVGCG